MVSFMFSLFQFQFRVDITELQLLLFGLVILITGSFNEPFKSYLQLNLYRSINKGLIYIYIYRMVSILFVFVYDI